MKREMRWAVVVYVVMSLGGWARGNDLERTLDAICMTESSGGKDKSDGDNGRARGPYQIHRSYWIDGTQALGVNWPYADAKNDKKARQVVRAYLLRYAPHGTPEVWCRLHNAGPAWKTKMKATDRYWAKAQKNFAANRDKS